MSNIEDSEIELDRAILIDSCHPCRRWCDIRGDEIELSDPECVEPGTDFFELKYTLLEEKNIGKSEIGVDLLDIDTDRFSFYPDDFRDHLEERSRSCSEIEDIHSLFYEVEFLLYLEEFEGTPSAISELFCFLEIGIMDDKWLWHNVKRIFLTFL